VSDQRLIAVRPRRLWAGQGGTRSWGWKAQARPAKVFTGELLLIIKVCTMKFLLSSETDLGASLVTKTLLIN
jgi:hypothetical protein